MSNSDRTAAAVQSLKNEAHELVERSREFGPPLPLKIAYERVAQAHGFPDWNTCFAVTKRVAHEVTAPPERASAEEFVEIPPFLGLNLPGEERASVEHLLTWAKRFDLLSVHTDASAYRDLIPLMGGPRPYLFERNEERWGDGLFRLVDRQYNPWPGITLTGDDLTRIGVPEWAKSGYCALAADGALPVLDERVAQVVDKPGLKQLAQVLVGVAVAVDRHYEAAARS